VVRNWSGAHKGWSTKAVKDAVVPAAVERRSAPGTIAPGVNNSVRVQVGKTASGGYNPFVFGVSMSRKRSEDLRRCFCNQRRDSEVKKQSLSAPSNWLAPRIRLL
jgi:hypothetical protein